MWNNSWDFDELFREYLDTRDKSLKDKLIETHLPLVTAIAGHYTGYLKHRRSLEFGDLIQEGRIGLMKCIDRYDPNKENRNFRAYAIWWIRQSILNAIISKSRTIKLPVNQAIKSDRLNSESENYVKRHGRKPTIEQLAEISSLPVDSVEELLQFSDPISIDSTYDDGEEERGARAVDNRPQQQQETRENSEHDQQFLQKSLKKANLTPEEKEILYKKYGLNGFPYPRTNESLGEEYGITGERIRQKLFKIESKIKIANGLTSKKSAET